MAECFEFERNFALAVDGTVLMSGWNGFGTLGDGTITDRTTPRLRRRRPPGRGEQPGRIAAYARRSSIAGGRHAGSRSLDGVQSEEATMMLV